MENRHLPNLGENDFFCLVDEGDLMRVWTLQQTKAEKKRGHTKAKVVLLFPFTKEICGSVACSYILEIWFLLDLFISTTRDPKNPFFSICFLCTSNYSRLYPNAGSMVILHVLQRGRLRDIHGTLQCEPIIDFIKLLFWNASAHVACTIALFINKRETRKKLKAWPLEPNKVAWEKPKQRPFGFRGRFVVPIRVKRVYRANNNHIHTCKMCISLMGLKGIKIWLCFPLGKSWVSVKVIVPSSRHYVFWVCR